MARDVAYASFTLTVIDALHTGVIIATDLSARAVGVGRARDACLIDAQRRVPRAEADIDAVVVAVILSADAVFILIGAALIAAISDAVAILIGLVDVWAHWAVIADVADAIFVGVS